jgi:hypothetical protein
MEVSRMLKEIKNKMTIKTMYKGAEAKFAKMRESYDDFCRDIYSFCATKKASASDAAIILDIALLGAATKSISCPNSTSVDVLGAAMISSWLSLPVIYVGEKIISGTKPKKAQTLEVKTR